MKKYEIILKATSFKRVFAEKKVDILIRKYTGKSLENLQSIVGGYIESVRPLSILPFCMNADDRFTVYCDDEGLLKHKRPSVRQMTVKEYEDKYELHIYGMIAGDCVIRGFNGIDDDEPLTADDVLDVVHSLWASCEDVNMEFDDIETRLELMYETVNQLDNMTQDNTIGLS